MSLIWQPLLIPGEPAMPPVPITCSSTPRTRGRWAGEKEHHRLL